jgi:hypothetical protein
MINIILEKKKEIEKVATSKPSLKKSLKHVGGESSQTEGLTHNHSCRCMVKLKQTQGLEARLKQQSSCQASVRPLTSHPSTLPFKKSPRNKDGL